MDYPLLLRRSADPAFIDHVARLADENFVRFTLNQVDPERRRYWQMEVLPDQTLADKKRELIDRFGLTNWIEDPYFRDLIGCIFEGGSVHPHIDMVCGDRMHVRINLLVQAPEAGCVPLLDGIAIDPRPGDAWVCFASHCEHATTAVIGRKPRVLLSYGFQVDRVAAFGIFAKYLAWRMGHAANDDAKARRSAGTA
jgi:hypothetical protein